ncbi:MAG: class I tRNA ligase family protein [Nostoc sp.]|uniref:class I tRNA ligase family protein n=1 Tax=Nostoc sp. TaxID=1180 RepID=UPI002FFADA72
MLEPTDLVEPHSAISQSKRLEVRKTKHLFLKLSTLSHEVTEGLSWPTPLY